MAKHLIIISISCSLGEFTEAAIINQILSNLPVSLIEFIQILVRPSCKPGMLAFVQ